MRTLLITGGSGFLGWNLIQVLTTDANVVATYHTHPFQLDGCQVFKVDLTERSQVTELINQIHPEVIVHTAALTSVAHCQKYREAAFAANVLATRYLIDAANTQQARFIYISTDLVFDGTKGRYTEHDSPNPLNYYAETKFLGEKEVRTHAENFLIVRVALMYGNGSSARSVPQKSGRTGGISGGFCDWMHATLQNRQPLALFVDQYRTPLYVREGAEAIAALLEQNVRNVIFHIGGAERINRYEFGKKFAATFGYDESLLKSVKMTEIPEYSIYGADCSLDSSKIRRQLNIRFSNVVEGLEKMRRERV
jgi:dTDP-4-dehydrorhamnose reductase